MTCNIQALKDFVISAVVCNVCIYSVTVSALQHAEFCVDVLYVRHN